MVSLPAFAQDNPAQTFSPGALLIQRGQRAAHMIHVQQGRVALGLWDGTGLQHRLGEVQGPSWLEAASGLLGLPHVLDAVAQTEVIVRAVPVAQFRQHALRMPEPSRSLLDDLARAQRQQSELAISRLAKDADARCAEWLIQHAEQDPVTHSLHVTLSERKRSIAAYLGIAPETFSRILRQLREREIISGRGRVLDLINPQALRALAGC